MPLPKPLEARRFSDAGPVPQALAVGEGMAVMLLCLQAGQALEAPPADASETLFHVLEGEGTVREGGAEHAVRAGDAVHVPPGARKALRCASGTLTVLGVRRMEGRRGSGPRRSP